MRPLSEDLNMLPEIILRHPVATGLGLVVSLILTKVIWNLFLSPMARQRIPGPWVAAASDIWYSYHYLKFDKVVAMHDAFQRYGPVVRVAPNRIMVNDAAAVQTIYATHAFKKGTWLTAVTYQGMPNSISTTNPAQHALFRRWTAPAFRGDNLRKVARKLEIEMDELLDHIRTHCSPIPGHEKGRYLDVLPLFKRFYLDLVGMAVLGTRFNQVASGEEHIIARLITDWLMDRVMFISFPGLLYNFLRHLPIPRLRAIFAADAMIFKAAEEIYDNAPDKASSEHFDIMSTCKAYRDSATGEPAPKKEVIGEVTVFLTAGTDTVSNTSVYLCWCLAKSEAVWSLLREEFSKVPSGNALEVEVLRSLPYLNAFLKEVFRLHGAGSSILERVVPPGGAVLAGYSIPGGAEIAGQAWSFHRNPEYFPDPLKLDPERWVKRGSTGGWVPRTDISQEVQAAWFPYGQGPRSCVGRPLADIEIMMFTSTIVRNFRVHLHPSTTEGSMAVWDAGVISPRAGKCLLRFEHAPLTAA